MFNSELQFISGEIAEFCGEPKKLGKYLGIVKHIGKQRAYQIFSELKQREAEYLHKRPPNAHHRLKTGPDISSGKQKTAESG